MDLPHNSLILIQACNWIPQYNFLPKEYQNSLCKLFSPIKNELKICYENVNTSQNRQAYDLASKLPKVLGIKNDCVELTQEKQIKEIKDQFTLESRIILGIFNDFKQFNFDLRALLTISKLSKEYPKMYFISKELKIRELSDTSFNEFEYLTNLKYTDIPNGLWEKSDFWTKKRIVK
jgi:hypothetical protein